jgi:hypothetical protein
MRLDAVMAVHLLVLEGLARDPDGRPCRPKSDARSRRRARLPSPRKFQRFIAPVKPRPMVMPGDIDLLTFDEREARISSPTSRRFFFIDPKLRHLALGRRTPWRNDRVRLGDAIAP